MSTRTLSVDEVTALCKWALSNRDNNWGSWSDYPITGCQYLQYEDNPIVVKFDSLTEFHGNKFKRIGQRRIKDNNSITFFRLQLILKDNYNIDVSL